ncbi:stage II sporulation protein D [Halalkalibacter hemicellulosilyticus]|uniref:Stage II sporulation protein D n=1 Tax=Halalkalibacter hemicellulosilyticusJCM 9152 TaxID=1236971 RepID=W4QJ02_9BACI|nr:stage II sporulation protein D [Halalkalibacter hemicellulosilyticus]GAE31314.1 stage II sporulation protein D [Halalkalibacter hemicellulosilyticusJCM 9152]
MKRILIVALILCTVILVIPTMLVVIVSPSPDVNVMQSAPTDEESGWDYDPSEDVSIAVFRSQQEVIDTLPLEIYVMGVVASEMNATFEMEALKAQALTARTYMIRHMLAPQDVDLPEGAMVTDTIMHQVYKDEEELREKWGSEYEHFMKRIEEAVLSTQGQVLTYDDEPIDAMFFSTSNGYTENSEDYWENEIPYLRSVESPWDQRSPRFTAETTFTVEEFEQKLGVTLPEDQSVGVISERTKGSRVAKVNINGTELTGRYVREELGLDSSDFQWRREGNQIIVQTRGWGHGVGMSQYGADGMAKEGRDYEEIVNHYYQGVTIEMVDPYVQELTAKAE